jgi:hypothetical protein
MTDRIFIEEESDSVALVPIVKERRTARTGDRDVDRKIERKTRYADLLPYGTDLEASWSEEWVNYVAVVERSAGHAVCGSRLRETELEQLVRAEKITEEQIEDDPLVQVCRFKAGLNTSHPGDGRCHRHGGSTDPSDKFSLLSHSTLSPRVREFFESDELLDLRGAIGLVWAGADALMGEDGAVDPARVQELGALMTRVGNLTKQHNDIMEKRKITIEVPEFIAWAEHFYELAIRYIMDGEKDVQGFLQEAQSYYNATVTLTVGLSPDGNSRPKSNPFGGDPSSEVLRSGESES